MSQDWLLITNDQNPPKGTSFAEHQPGYEFALCELNWRDETFSETEDGAALRRFCYFQMCELYSHYGQANLHGALVDYSKKHPEYEVWFNGRKF